MAMRRTVKVVLQAAVLFVAAAVIGACESGPPKISIDDARAILSPEIYGEALVTMNIRNEGGPDMLTGVSVDIPGALATFHVTEGRRMVWTARVKIPSRDTVVFKLGGSHVMLQNMPRSVKEGTKCTVTLTFQKSGERKIPLAFEKYSGT